MADFYLDHNVAVELGHLLRGLGHTVRTADELGLAAAKDDEHLLLASERAWIFVTNNKRDFTLLHGAWKRWATAWGVTPQHFGIMIMPQESPGDLPRARVAQAIEDLIRNGAPLANECYEWRPSRGWVPCGT
jgi:hypothetical protein